MTRLMASGLALAAAGLTWASPIQPECIGARGCIALPTGGTGVFEVYALFDAEKFTQETHWSEGFFKYNDGTYNLTSTAIFDYADPAGYEGYRILSFRVADPNYPEITEVRIRLDDLGSAPTSDRFEIQFHGPGTFVAYAGNLLSACGGGVGISRECGTQPPQPPQEPPVAECDDFVTGGGWINGPNGRKANFGVHGGIRNGNLWGGLNFIDHGNRLHVKSTAVTGYQHIDQIGREIRFNVTIDGEPGTAVVHVWDNGEPGRNDVFQLVLSTGYTAGGDLGGARPGGGNLQLHKAKCDKPDKGAKPVKAKGKK